MRPLRRLDRRARARLTAAFLRVPAGESVVADITEHVTPLHRELDVEPSVNIVRHAMSRMMPVESDAWLASRLHSCLRLHRYEAADGRLWDYLAVVECPEYVRWRWPGKDGEGTPVDRFMGPQYKQAFARLWWGAELTHNGIDYSSVTQAFRLQDIPNQWLRYDLFHHRPAALAAVRLLSSLNGGRGGTHDEVVQLAKAFNLALTTTVLDLVSLNPDPDMAAIEDWMDERVDETLLFDREPLGPPEIQVSESAIANVEQLLLRIGGESRIFPSGADSVRMQGNGGPPPLPSVGWMLEQGSVYTRHQLRREFGITDQSLFNGVFVAPGQNAVWMFVTEQKTPDRTPYRDVLEGDTLYWDGQTAGATDDLIIDHRTNGLRLLLFYRRKKYEYPGAGFKLVGEFNYVSHSGSRPTQFVLRRAETPEGGAAPRTLATGGRQG